MTLTMETAISAASEAAFGSCARGDTDSLSDRDFLIVDDDVQVLRTRSAALKAEGLSVAAYTFRKLEYLAAKGALFVQHLRLESAIMADRDGRLALLLSSFQPKNAYEAEIKENTELARLIATTPPGAVSELWAADVLYVTVRNFGVLWLASRGRYVFAYDRILDALREEGVLNDDGVSNLRQLRFLKSLYRSEASSNVGVVKQKVQAALIGLPREHFPPIILTVPVHSILAAPAPADGLPAYLSLRDLEKRMLAARYIAGGSFDDAELEALSQWVRDPRVYANLSATQAPALRAKLAALSNRARILRTG